MRKRVVAPSTCDVLHARDAMTATMRKTNRNARENTDEIDAICVFLSRAAHLQTMKKIAR
jgi:hypothetical protein